LAASSCSFISPIYLQSKRFGEKVSSVLAYLMLLALFSVVNQPRSGPEEGKAMLVEMSHGSPLVSVRIPEELLELVDRAVARSVDTRKDGPWTRSSFILAAIEEKLKKMARSAGRAKCPVPPTYKRDLSTF
jgi:hypothetical protein